MLGLRAVCPMGSAWLRGTLRSGSYCGYNPAAEKLALLAKSLAQG